MSNIQKDHGIVAEQSRLLHFPRLFFNRDGVKRVTLAWKRLDNRHLRLFHSC